MSNDVKSSIWRHSDLIYSKIWSGYLYMRFFVDSEIKGQGGVRVKNNWFIPENLVRICLYCIFHRLYAFFGKNSHFRQQLGTLVQKYKNA